MLLSCSDRQPVLILFIQPWTVTLDDDEPIAVYCSANGHCQDGMVAVINGKKS